MLCEDLGKLLINISNAAMAVFNDNAFIDVKPSSQKDDNVLLDIIMTIKCKGIYTPDEYDQLLNMFDELVFNPLINSDSIYDRINLHIRTI